MAQGLNKKKDKKNFKKAIHDIISVYEQTNKIQQHVIQDRDELQVWIMECKNAKNTSNRFVYSIKINHRYQMQSNLYF